MTINPRNRQQILNGYVVYATFRCMEPRTQPRSQGFPLLTGGKVLGTRLFLIFTKAPFLLGWSRSGEVIQDLSGSWCIKGTGEFTLFMDSPVPLMHHDPDRSWITDLHPDHPKGTQPKSRLFETQILQGNLKTDLRSANYQQNTYGPVHGPDYPLTLMIIF